MEPISVNPEYHVPALTESSVPGEWITYCPACSDIEQDWVTVCLRVESGESVMPWPPKTMADASWKWTMERIQFRDSGPVVRMTSTPTDTQIEAAKVAKVKAGTKQETILNLVASFGDQGLTDNELEIITKWTHQSVSGARNALMMRGMIRDSGQRRPNQRGNREIAWVSV